MTAELDTYRLTPVRNGLLSSRSHGPLSCSFSTTAPIGVLPKLIVGVRFSSPAPGAVTGSGGQAHHSGHRAVGLATTGPPR
jgi:hypothetical protein